MTRLLNLLDETGFTVLIVLIALLLSLSSMSTLLFGRPARIWAGC